MPELATNTLNAKGRILFRREALNQYFINVYKLLLYFQNFNFTKFGGMAFCL